MKSETIKAGPYTLSYTHHKGKKPMTIIPIHGLGGSKDYWQHIHDYPELAAYNILIPDLIGFGDSRPRQRVSNTRCGSKRRRLRHSSTPFP